MSVGLVRGVRVKGSDRGQCQGYGVRLGSGLLTYLYHCWADVSVGLVRGVRVRGQTGVNVRVTGSDWG